ncbi:MAG: response regulator [Verrucomicrobiota bacterium]
MKKIRIVAVDDNEIILHLIRHCLGTDKEYELTLCNSGEEVLTRLHKPPRVDVLLLDWNMPEMSGMDLLCTVRADSRYDHVRVMMLTVKSELEDVRKALEAGAGEYLMKPFNKEMLVNKLQLLLQN